MPPHKKISWHSVWIFFALFLGIGASYLLIKGGTIAYGALYNKTEKFISSEVVVPILPPVSYTKTTKTLSIGFVGDIIPSINTPLHTFAEVVSHTEKPDIMIGNFEGAATGNVYTKCKKGAINCFAFNGDQGFLGLLASTSFNVLNVANNHFNDYGEDGRKETILEIEEAGMSSSGVEDQITYLEKNNIKVAIVGFSTYEWTTNMNKAENVNMLVQEAKANADIVVVVFHGGGEGDKYAHTPVGVEWYLNENRGDVRGFAYTAIDSGADIVLGSGPHVLRGIENYNGKIIAYSLGNFVSVNNFKKALLPKTSAILNVTLKKDGSFAKGEIVPLQIDEYGVPHLDTNNAAITVINELSKTDFEEQGISVENNGKINL